MKWILYVAFWIYAAGITIAGFLTVFSPANADKLTGQNHLTTDVFTFVGLLMIYLAYASSKQHFDTTNTTKKRFDLLMLSLLNIVVLTIPIIFAALFSKNLLALWHEISDRANYLLLLGGLGGVLLVIALAYAYSIRIFNLNR